MQLDGRTLTVNEAKPREDARAVAAVEAAGTVAVAVEAVAAGVVDMAAAAAAVDTNPA